MKQFDLLTGLSDPQEQSDQFTTKPSNATRKHSTGAVKRTLLSGIEDFFDGELNYVANFIENSQTPALFIELRRSLQWQSDKIKVYGKWHVIPRLQAWYGFPKAEYQYSGKHMAPLPLPAQLEQLRKLCSHFAGVEFNSVLANLYRGGQDCMGFHSDDEPELGVNPVIASLTLGATRRFDLIHKKQPVKLQLNLPSGSLLVMRGSTQQHWQHGIARIKRPVGERINLTFRHIKGQGTTVIESNKILR